jgi:O-antigen ligase
MTSAWVFAVVLALTWGAGAFGAVYPWAYGPLLIASAILGVAGAALGRGAPPWSVAIGLAAIGFVATLQLLPLDPAVVERFNPAAMPIHYQRNLALAAGSAPKLTLSIDPARTLLALVFLGSFGLLLVGSARMLDRSSSRQLAAGIAILGVALAFVGIIQNATFNGKLYGFWELKQGGAPFGPFVNRNHYAGWMLMAVPLTMGALAAAISRATRRVHPGFRGWLLRLSSEKGNTALLLAFALVTMALALALSFSRSGMLGIAALLFVAAWMTARRQATFSRRAALWSIWVFLAVMMASWVGVDRIAARFAHVDLDGISERPAIWADTIRIIRDFPVLGTGLNTYGVSTLFYQTSDPGQHLREAHNDYLQVAAEGGVLLVVPIVFTMVAFTRMVRLRLSEDLGSVRWIRLGAVAGIVAIAVQSLVEFSLQMPGNAALFTMLGAIALHDGRTTSQHAVSHEHARPS